MIQTGNVIDLYWKVKLSLALAKFNICGHSLYGCTLKEGEAGTHSTKDVSLTSSSKGSSRLRSNMDPYDIYPDVLSYAPLVLL